jgi:nicotinate-nucleotide adenylyltransferase
MKTGLFGGTFDPPHLAHLAIAESALSFVSLDRVVWIPAAVPPHRKPPVASPEQRLDMVKLAIADDDRFEVSDIELRRTGTSYTVDTIQQLQQGSETGELFLIIGGDSLRSFHTWYKPEVILESIQLIVFDRDEHRYSDVDPWILESALIIPETPLLEISGTEIRDRIRKGLSIRDLVPQEVAEYIRRHELYH